MSQPHRNLSLAASLAVAAAGLAAATTLIAKALGTGVLGPPLHALQISQGRFIFAFIALSGTALVLRPQFSRPNWALHLGRSTLDWLGVTLMFAAATFIPLSDATAISFLNPVFGMLFAIAFLGERIGPWRWLSAMVALAGALILMRPGVGALQIGALIALMSALCLGGELIFAKRLSGLEFPLQILLVNNGIGLIIASLAAALVWQNPTFTQWIALAGIGLLMAAAQACFIHALRRAEASFVSPFLFCALAFATLYDLLIFQVWPDRISWSGALLILSGAALLAWRETRQR